ncbi:hypothetical protein ACVWXQ_007148 [Bradyrhizobium sp. S3.14.4]
MSSTEGSLTKMGWKRRASAASFSTCFRYSSSVVAPMQCSSPRAKRGLEQVGRVHRAVALAGADQRMHLVDEQDEIALARGDFLEHGLQPLLELAAIFRTRNQRAEIKREQLLVLEGLGHVAVDDAQREALGDGGLADAGLTDQDGIVLGPAREHLDGAADLLIAADDRIELAVARSLGQVAGIFLQRVIGILGGRGVRRAALAQRLDRGIEVLRGDAALGQDRAGLAGLFQREAEQQPLDGDKTVASLLAGLFGGVESAGELGRQIDLAGAAAGDLRHLVEGILGRLQDGAGIAAGAVDQTSSEALIVVQQNFQDVQRRKLLMPLAHRKRLRGLNEAPGAFGIFVDVHVFSFPRPAPGAL